MEREKFKPENFGEDNFGIVTSDEMAQHKLSQFLTDEPEEEVNEEEVEEEPIKKLKTTQKQQTQKAPQKKAPKKEFSIEERSDLALKMLLEDEAPEEEEEEEKEGEEEKPEVKPKPKSAAAANEEEEDVNIFSAVAKELYSSGIFTKDTEDEQEEVIESAEELLDRLRYESRKLAANVVDAYVSKYGESHQRLFDHVFVKGLNPYDFLEKSQKIESVSSMDMKKVENWRRVVRANLTVQGYDDEYIENKVSKLENSGDIEEEAIASHKILMKREQDDLEKKAKAAEAKNKQKVEDSYQYRQNVNRIISDKLKVKDFDGIPVNEQSAQSVLNYLTVDKYKTAEGDVITDFERDLLELKKPQNHEMRVKLAMIMQLLKTDPTLSRIKKKALSEETNKLFSDLSRKNKLKKQEEQDKTAKGYFE